MIEDIIQRIAHIANLTVGELFRELVHILKTLWSFIVEIAQNIAGKL